MIFKKINYRKILIKGMFLNKKQQNSINHKQDYFFFVDKIFYHAYFSFIENCWNSYKCQETDTDKCHIECLGCKKYNSSKDCLACKNFDDNGDCVAKCPKTKWVHICCAFMFWYINCKILFAFIHKLNTCILNTQWRVFRNTMLT